MKVVVFFEIFGAIGAMVLIITFASIELEGYACAQIKALEEGNGRLYPDDAWVFVRERGNRGKPDQ